MNFSKSEKITLGLLVLIVVLIAIGVGLLLTLPDPAATPRLSPEQALAKWRTPYGYAATLALICDESVATVNESTPEDWPTTRMGLGLSIGVIAGGIRDNLTGWQPTPDQAGIQTEITGQAEALLAFASEEQGLDDAKKTLAARCQEVAGLRDKVLGRAVDEGANEGDMIAIMEGD